MYPDRDDKNHPTNRATSYADRPRRSVDLTHPRFPRASRCDPAWIMAGEMGPNVLWLTEALCEQMTLEPGMRVLDMGCRRGLSAVFLAREAAGGSFSGFPSDAEALERDNGQYLAFPLLVARRNPEADLGTHSTEFRL